MAASDIDFAFVGRIVDEAQSCLRPIKESEILPAEAYVSEEFWKFEKRAIFSDIARTCAEQPAAGFGLIPAKAHWPQAPTLTSPSWIRRGRP